MSHAASEELRDILAPPDFRPTGTVKSSAQAIADGDWVGSINIWLYTLTPEPSIIYQERLKTGAWAPGMLDVAAAGHYTTGESGLDGLRELSEELGITVAPEDCHYFGRRININIDSRGRERHSVSEVYDVEFKGNAADFVLQADELEGVVVAPIRQLMQMYRTGGSFEAEGIDPSGKIITYDISAESFVQNYDDYQRKMVEYLAAKLGVDDFYFTGK
ncbi:MAG TPA: hypothetical protein VF572_03035 [Candidatus Saccharimonadales bacterium]|jgi:hypothetical protein